MVLLTFIAKYANMYIAGNGCQACTVINKRGEHEQTDQGVLETKWLRRDQQYHDDADWLCGQPRQPANRTCDAENDERLQQEAAVRFETTTLGDLPPPAAALNPQPTRKPRRTKRTRLFFFLLHKPMLE